MFQFPLEPIVGHPWSILVVGQSFDVVFPSQDILFIESFAGNAQATESVRCRFPDEIAAAMDIKYSAKLDINSNSGMANFVKTLFNQLSVLKQQFVYLRGHRHYSLGNANVEMICCDDH